MNQAELKALLHYNPESGEFTYLVDRWRVKAGDKARSVRDTGKKRYYRLKYRQKQYQLHRLAFLYMNGEMPKGEVDHINGNSLDNRWENLRIVSRQENSRNVKKANRNTSGVVGVTWNKAVERWQSQIGVDGKCVFLGYFSDLSEACSARACAESLYGFHENHGK